MSICLAHMLSVADAESSANTKIVSITSILQNLYNSEIGMNLFFEIELLTS